MIHSCDGRTDGQTDGRAIAYTRYSIYAVARKKHWSSSFLLLYFCKQSPVSLCIVDSLDNFQATAQSSRVHDMFVAGCRRAPLILSVIWLVINPYFTCLITRMTMTFTQNCTILTSYSAGDMTQHVRDS